MKCRVPLAFSQTLLSLWSVCPSSTYKTSCRLPGMTLSIVKTRWPLIEYISTAALPSGDSAVWLVQDGCPELLLIGRDQLLKTRQKRLWLPLQAQLLPVWGLAVLIGQCQIPVSKCHLPRPVGVPIGQLSLWQGTRASAWSLPQVVEDVAEPCVVEGVALSRRYMYHTKKSSAGSLPASCVCSSILVYQSHASENARFWLLSPTTPVFEASPSLYGKATGCFSNV